ncbi:MAG: membrane protein insertase YidC [Oscillospiraceae bacterium]|nr:membrane protein insertase YidC [Oscillospiraceae bacterium]
MELISKPFGMLMMWLYNVTHSYGLAVIIFAIIVRLIMLPFQMKSKRSMMRTQLLQPQLQELQKKYGSNQQKYGEELQKLYKEENINPMSGCLWSLIPFPIMIALYYAIREPITCMMGIAKELIQEGGAILTKLTELGFQSTANAGYIQIAMSKFISEHFSSFSGISDKLVAIDYKFLGLDLGETPNFRVWEYTSENMAANLGLLLVPIIAAALSYAVTAVSQKLNPPADPQAAATTSSMNLMMPIMTLVFCFMMPAALGIYWIMGSILSIIQEIVLTNYYKGILATETREIDERRKKREAELEAKRAETERLRAEGATLENESTSKKKKAQREKAQRAEAERQYQDSLTGEDKYEPSRVGHRKYARGRAYDPDRYLKSTPSGQPEENGTEPEEEGTDNND